MICQNDSQAMEFRGYGGTFMKRHGFSPDAFVQMAFQAAYYGLYGESTCPGSRVRLIASQDALKARTSPP